MAKLIKLIIILFIVALPVYAQIGSSGSIGGTQFFTINGSNNYGGLATSTSIYPPTGYVLSIGTTTTAYEFGLANLTVYGSSTVIQTRVNNANAFVVRNAASSTIFRVDTTLGGIRIDGTGTSTGAGGLNLTAGCFAINGTCVAGSSVSGSGTANELAYWTAATALSSNSAFAVNSGNSRLTVTNLVTTNATDTQATSTYLRVSTLGSVQDLLISSLTTNRVLFSLADIVSDSSAFTFDTGRSEATITNLVNTLSTSTQATTTYLHASTLGSFQDVLITSLTSLRIPYNNASDILVDSSAMTFEPGRNEFTVTNSINTLATSTQATTTTLYVSGTATSTRIENGINLLAGCFAINGTCAGGGTPGGATTELQFNNASAFGGMSQFTYVSPTLTVSATGVLNLSSALTFRVPVSASSTIALTGELELDTTDNAIHANFAGTTRAFPALVCPIKGTFAHIPDDYSKAFGTTFERSFVATAIYSRSDVTPTSSPGFARSGYGWTFFLTHGSPDASTTLNSTIITVTTSTIATTTTFNDDSIDAGEEVFIHTVTSSSSDQIGNTDVALKTSVCGYWVP